MVSEACEKDFFVLIRSSRVIRASIPPSYTLYKVKEKALEEDAGENFIKAK